jgi:hypothetical protein
MPALNAQGLDASAGGLGDAQTVEGTQSDQSVFARRSQAGGYQQRAQFVAVQAGGLDQIF